MLIGIENSKDSIPINNFSHPERTIYLLGSEDNGLTKTTLAKCHKIIILPGEICLNVSVAGSIVMYDRIKQATG